MIHFNLLKLNQKSIIYYFLFPFFFLSSIVNIWRVWNTENLSIILIIYLFIKHIYISLSIRIAWIIVVEHCCDTITTHVSTLAGQEQWARSDLHKIYRYNLLSSILCFAFKNYMNYLKFKFVVDAHINGAVSLLKESQLLY